MKDLTGSDSLASFDPDDYDDDMSPQQFFSLTVAPKRDPNADLSEALLHSHIAAAHLANCKQALDKNDSKEARRCLNKALGHFIPAHDALSSVHDFHANRGEKVPRARVKTAGESMFEKNRWTPPVHAKVTDSPSGGRVISWRSSAPGFG